MSSALHNSFETEPSYAKQPSQDSDAMSADSHAKSYFSDEQQQQQSSPPREPKGRHAGNSGLLATILLILLIGAGASAAFLSIGILSAQEDQDEQFQKSARSVVATINIAWRDYSSAARMVHHFCRYRNFTRQDYRDLYEYIVAGGQELQAVHFVPNVSHAERPAYEAEARDFFETYYPQYEYYGFRGFNADNRTVLAPRDVQPYYQPIHWSEPVDDNWEAADLDTLDGGIREKDIRLAIDQKMPTLTGRIRLVQETSQDTAYAVALIHPGVPLSEPRDVWPRDLANVVIRIPDLLRRSTSNQAESVRIVLFDRQDDGSSIFLGGVQVDISSSSSTSNDVMNRTVTDLPEMTLSDALAAGDRHETVLIPVENKEWYIVITAVNAYEPHIVFVVLGGIMIIVSSLCLAAWVFTTTRRVARHNEVTARMEAEKTALLVDSAQQATKAERELNDFLAHEVRNPISAAMAACSFVKTAVHKEDPLQTPDALKTVQDDVDTIEHALAFVSDLLRNMLDMHRATNKKLKLNLEPIDVATDVLEPCASMLTQGSGVLQVITECPPNVIIQSDRLRLKQICLNLGRNSSKFVEEGFIRLSAEVVNGRVQLSVADSGPGIPLEKQQSLFTKYQDSLDVLSQGTGIGLFLCKNITEILGGEIRLDNDYHSGIPGRPGCRFVIDLNAEPIEMADLPNLDSPLLDHEHQLLSMEEGKSSSSHRDLPERISVLFVDDDPTLRKLFKRTIKVVAPLWDIREAANGETAIHLASDEGIHFDLIFVDMYMTAVTQQMLGTEAVRELRHRGVTARICGLSANNKEQEFVQAGADAFLMKPIPFKKDDLKRELNRILYDD